MAKIVLKMEGNKWMPKTKVKAHDTGHIKSVIPALISFLKAIGYDSVTDVRVVFTGPRGSEAVHSKDGLLTSVDG